ncbi:YkvA family protein [Staphylococcus simulans]|uniref:YkvA family protein n=1 Tax=Staphylococcus simulans TaxID=1286 RepID=UPI0021D0BA33|nr:YkvA family protein [Staphylococcus simulans]UXR49301.1 YkvA family protein [Staphylococcus simulans]
MNINFLPALKSFVAKMNQELLVLYLSSKDQRTPMTVKILAVCIVAYALSPIDLIPDFIPVLGYLDDIIIVPLGIALCLKLIPEPILQDNRRKASELNKNILSQNWYAGVLIIILWIIVISVIGYFILKNFFW